MVPADREKKKLSLPYDKPMVIKCSDPGMKNSFISCISIQLQLANGELNIEQYIKMIDHFVQ